MQQLWRWRKLWIVVAVVLLVALIYNTSQPRSVCLCGTGTQGSHVTSAVWLDPHYAGCGGVFDALRDIWSLRQRNARLESRVVELQTEVYRLSGCSGKRVLTGSP